MKCHVVELADIPFVTRLLTFVLLLLSSQLLSAQTVITGHVYDVGTRSDLQNVTITLKSTSKTTNTNLYGDFVLSGGSFAEDKTPRFAQNAFFWSEEVSATTSVYSLNGKLLFKQSFTGKEYLLPRLNPGMFLLTIQTEHQLYQYKLLSDRNHTISADRGSHFHQNQLIETDTLILSKPGYFDRQVAIKTDGKTQEIAMLTGDYANLNYFSELIAPLAYDLISGDPSRSNLGDVQEVKIIYDNKADKLYYMNSKKYDLHFVFAYEVLGYDKGLYIYNLTQYTNNPSRYLEMASIQYYQAIDQYALQFVTAVEMTCPQVENLYQKILETSFFTTKNLKFYAIKDEWKNCTAIPQIDSETLYAGQIYQGLNIAENYGYLKRVSAEELPTTYLSRRDLVVTDGVPNDLPVVAGIITSDFQTPLSHINVLSHSRNTPNMALRGAFDSLSLQDLEGLLVYLKVQPNHYTLRTATLQEATAFWSKKEPKDTIHLGLDGNYQTLVDMSDVNYSFVNKIGGKASNFGEILNVTTAEISTPENAFAIPFYYYLQHTQRYGLQKMIAGLLAEPRFKSDASYRAQMLQKVQDSIISSPLDENLKQAVAAKINHFQTFDSFKFRSSTNAEDLEDFSGAGLYDSFAAKKDHDTKTIENAIRQTWASLWNLRAFEERDYFKINHLTCAMGVLVHRSFGDEDANGVLITKNLYNQNPGFTINVQYKENSIVFPEPGILHDQILLFTWSVDPQQEFMIEYLTFSNIPELNGETVMTDQELYELGKYAKAIKRRFYYDLPHHCDCVYDDFGVDIEFKVDSELSPRKVYIKQARLYK